jgi:hypothetical protein
MENKRFSTHPLVNFGNGISAYAPPELDFIDVWSLFDREINPALKATNPEYLIAEIGNSLICRAAPWIKTKNLAMLPGIQVIEVARDTAIHPAQIVKLLANNDVLFPIRKEYYQADLAIPDFSHGLSRQDSSLYGLPAKRVEKTATEQKKARLFTDRTIKLNEIDWPPTMLQMAIERSEIFLNPTGMTVPENHV